MTMNEGAIEYVISCDYPGCKVESMYLAYSMKVARNIFEGKGWTFKGSMMEEQKCYCPMHSKKEETA